MAYPEKFSGCPPANTGGCAVSPLYRSDADFTESDMERYNKKLQEFWNADFSANRIAYCPAYTGKCAVSPLYRSDSVYTEADRKKYEKETEDMQIREFGYILPKPDPALRVRYPYNTGLETWKSRLMDLYGEDVYKSDGFHISTLVPPEYASTPSGVIQPFDMDRNMDLVVSACKLAVQQHNSFKDGIEELKFRRVVDCMIQQYTSASVLYLTFHAMPVPHGDDLTCQAKVMLESMSVVAFRFKPVWLWKNDDCPEEDAATFKDESCSASLNKRKLDEETESVGYKTLPTELKEFMKVYLEDVRKSDGFHVSTLLPPEYTNALSGIIQPFDIEGNMDLVLSACKHAVQHHNSSKDCVDELKFLRVRDCMMQQFTSARVLYLTFHAMPVSNGDVLSCQAKVMLESMSVVAFRIRPGWSWKNNDYPKEHVALVSAVKAESCSPSLNKRMLEEIGSVIYKRMPTELLEAVMARMCKKLTESQHAQVQHLVKIYKASAAILSAANLETAYRHANTIQEICADTIGAIDDETRLNKSKERLPTELTEAHMAHMDNSSLSMLS